MERGKGNISVVVKCKVVVAVGSCDQQQEGKIYNNGLLEFKLIFWSDI